MELTRGELQRLAALVAERSGLIFPESRWPFLRRQAGGVLLRSGFTSAARWAEELERPGRKGVRLYADLEEALQVPATRFFRYADHYAVLREIVIPARREALEQEGGCRMRFWSVGCASGEEVYSIAMVVRESLPGPPWRAEVVGVDASQSALAAARRATYRSPAVAAVPPAYLARYFVPQQAAFTVAPVLREMTAFYRYDIRNGFYLGKFDAVFCCNLLLYYTPELRRRILEGLAASLHPGGFLFLGHAEGVTPPLERFEPVACPGGFVYRRA